MTLSAQAKLGIDCSADFHVHVGQFYQKYYSPQNVIEAVLLAGIKSIVFSSTSAGVSSDNKAEMIELHDFVQNEVSDTLELASKAGIEAKAFLWVSPEFWKAGFSLEKDLESGLYAGIKLNPRTFFERYSPDEQDEIVEKTFCVARDFNLPILLHTGIDEGLDCPKRFERFFKDFSTVSVTLAHIRDYETCIDYFARYNNLLGDTAFASDEAINAVCNAGFVDRLRFGTDFPVTHYFVHRDDGKSEDVGKEELILQYKADIG